MCATKRRSEAERKKEIMDAAANVISEKGLDNTSMEDIIAKTTLSKGGVYHYYSNVLEIFKDLMICGIEYRNEIIKDHLTECKKGYEVEFMAKQLTEKILDNNPYQPLYVEFLIAKRRNKKLEELMWDLEKQTGERFQKVMENVPGWLFCQSTFRFLTDFMNGMMIASDVLDAREGFRENRQLLEQMLILIFNKGKEDDNGCL